MDETYRGYLVAALAALIIDAALLFAIFCYIRTFWQRRHWGFVKGMIVEVGERIWESQSGVVTYEYVVDGKTYRVGPVGDPGHLGEEIEVTYRKDNPEISEIFQPGTIIFMIVSNALVALPLTYYALSHL
jgi:hypothetical protein